MKLLRSVLLVASLAIFASSTLVHSQAPVAAPDNDLRLAIRTPPSPKTPRINGARVFGAYPGHPFLFHVPVTGVRPIEVTAQGLPPGLSVDEKTGNLTGQVAQAGEYVVSLTATNSLGKATSTLKIVIGETICLTPSMGWNSWNCFYNQIDEAKIREAADSMVATGLIDHGWTFINIDDTWEAPQRDSQGRLNADPKKFSNLKALADYVHGLGLKMGIYSSPGPFTCGHYIATYGHEDQDAQTFAEMGMDYLKYDWCWYGAVADIYREHKYAELLPDSAEELKDLGMEQGILELLAQGFKDQDWGGPGENLQPKELFIKIEPKTEGLTKPQIEARLGEIKERLKVLHAKIDPAKSAAIDLDAHQEPYRVMRASLNKVNRDIVFSFCQYGDQNVWEWGQAVGGNLWRTTGDISPTWERIEEIGFSQNGHEAFAGPGHWNDPDMLEVGNGKLTPDENYTHMTLWCMLAAPLLIGCDMTKMNPLVLSLFTNDEVLAVDQDSLGKQGYRIKQEGKTEVWMKPLADGSTALAFFNRGPNLARVAIKWEDLKINSPQFVRDLWRQKDIGRAEKSYAVAVAPHGAELFQIHSVP